MDSKKEKIRGDSNGVLGPDLATPGGPGDKMLKENMKEGKKTLNSIKKTKVGK